MVEGILDASGGVFNQNVTITNKGNGTVTWETSSTWRGVTTGFIDVRGNNVYRLSLAETVSYVVYAWYDRNKNFILRSNYSGDNMQSLTAPNNAYYVRFTFQQSAAGTYTYTSVQLELGSTATTYEPYQGNTYPITFAAEAGTVYGGTLDVTNGVLTVDRAGVHLNTLTFDEHPTATNVFYTVSLEGRKLGVTNIISDMFAAAGNSVSSLPIGRMRGLTNNKGLYFCYQAANVSAFMAAVDNSILVYELAQPQTYQLTPQEVSTLLGTNNIWADCGDVEVEYRADTKLYIQKINAPADDDMTADAQIASGKYFIIGNNLYLSTTTIPAGDTIIPGTNCQKTNLAEALNALNT
jgi:hypothetical protein